VTARWHSLLHADPWALELIDLPSLNAGASAAIERAIQYTRKAARTDPATLRGRSIVVLGPAGAGKTHLFARLRRNLGRRAAFVLVRPLLGSAITPRYLLMQIVEQLARESHGAARIELPDGSGSRTFTQLDALLGLVAADLLADSSRPSAVGFEQLRPSSEQEQDARVDRLVEGMLERWPHADESYLRLLLRTPFAPARDRRALLGWLSGREPDEAQLARIGLRDGMRDELVLPALKTLGAVAAPGAPIVLVFDQLENLIDPHDEGRVRSYGCLVAELVDEVPGIVVVQMALDSEWHRGIEPALGTSQRTRVALELAPLSLPTAAEREQLLRLWASRLVDSPEAFPAPFGESRVSAWCAEAGMTPRMLLIACSRAIEQGIDQAAADDLGQDEVEADERERRADAMAEAWQEQIVRARALLDDANEEGRCVEAELLGDALGAAIQLVPGMSVASTNYSQVAQLAVELDSERLQVALLAKTHPRSVAAALEALVRVAEHGRVLAVRERAHELRPTWKICSEKRDRLLESPNGRWLDLEREDEAQLLALQGLLADARSRDVTDDAGRPLEAETVRQWAQAELGVGQWAPIRALLDSVKPSTAARLVARNTSPGPAPTAGVPRRASREPSAAMPRAHPTQATESGTASVGPALGMLLQLRVASLDRLVREVARVHGPHTRAAVLAELELAAARVQWFGRAVVAVQEEP
jgi:hypothetical protein